jgi:enamine deaminase RidA (YjgF/YER057c/UK114 family)
MAALSLQVTERHGRQCVSTGAPWEPIVGYSRAVRSGPWIAVSGTVGINPDGSYPPTMGAQTQRALEILQAALEQIGAKLENVLRTRMFVTDIRCWQEVARVHGRFFGDIRPATSMVEVSQLIDPQALMEIEADAVVLSLSE